jgi:hypothetical protein
MSLNSWWDGNPDQRYWMEVTTTGSMGDILIAPSLEYASGHLIAAVSSVARSERPLQERLQMAWDHRVQMLWMKPCLTSDLLSEFKDFVGTSDLSR